MYINCSSPTGSGDGGDTPKVPTLPTVVSTTNEGSAMETHTTITISGNVTNTGNTEITARGVAWGTTADPIINGSETVEEENTFTSTITPLTANTTYHFRVYATNSVGTSYGENQEFRTLAITAPLITDSTITSTASSTTSITITATPTITDGGSNILQKGFVYATSTMPTTGVTAITGNSPFTSTITLTAGNNYYFRTFASNVEGITYGEEFIHSTHSLGGTTWTFMISGAGNTNTTSTVMFRGDGTATISTVLPASPFLLELEGTWSLSGKMLTYDSEGRAPSNVYSGNLSDDGTMLSGTNITAGGPRTFTATKN